MFVYALEGNQACLRNLFVLG